MYTSQISEDINNIICLSPSAKYSLEEYLKGLDGEQIINDIEDEVEKDD